MTYTANVRRRRWGLSRSGDTYLNGDQLTMRMGRPLNKGKYASRKKCVPSFRRIFPGFFVCAVLLGTGHTLRTAYKYEKMVSSSWVAVSHTQPQTQHDDKENRTTNLPRQKRNYSQIQFWRYDVAAPEIQHSKLHFLSSIPDYHRVTFTFDKTENVNVTKALDLYASDVNNTFPNKHHLAEINPSIAKLPQSVLSDEEWLQTFGGGDNNKDSMPLYVATYRVTNQMACIPSHTLAIKFGGDYSHWRGTRPKTEYLGVALLDHKLDIVADITVSVFQQYRIFKKEYEDYRVFNLRSGGEENKEQLYLTTYNSIVPIQLTLSRTKQKENNKPPINGYVRFPPAFPLSSPNSREEISFQIWTRSFPSCIAPDGKNLLYFDEMDSTTSKGVIRSKTGVLYFPSNNPNPVFLGDLTQRCNTTKQPASKLPYMTRLLKEPPLYPPPSFQTMDQEIYPNRNDLFTSDRGSACCIQVQEYQIPIAPSMRVHMNNVTNHNKDNTNINDTLLVALVHLKTKFPGRNLPAGVTPNTYLSRFIAFLPNEPYTIVARTGLFCLGWPKDNENLRDHRNYHNSILQNSQLTFGTESLANCPRIHFIMSMIDKPKNHHHQDNLDEEELVILSYGVLDCFSRFIQVKKTDIINMFRGTQNA